MLGYVFRRILFAIPIAIGVSIVCFSLVYLAPGDPLQTGVAAGCHGGDDRHRQARPMASTGRSRVQYIIWLWHVLHGDFGRSIATQRPVTLEVFGSVANTAMLALFAVPISFVVGFGMGALAGCFPGRIMDRVVTGAAVIGVSLPNYWLGLVLVIMFAVQYMILPASGMGQSGSAAFVLWHWSDAQFLVLPVITLTMIPIGIIARTTRAAVADVRSQEFRDDAPGDGARGGAVIGTC